VFLMCVVGCWVYIGGCEVSFSIAFQQSAFDSDNSPLLKISEPILKHRSNSCPSLVCTPQHVEQPSPITCRGIFIKLYHMCFFTAPASSSTLGFRFALLFDTIRALLFNCRPYPSLVCNPPSVCPSPYTFRVRAQQQPALPHSEPRL
jgi:hypothetical protein